MGGVRAALGAATAGAMAAQLAPDADRAFGGWLAAAAVLAAALALVTRRGVGPFPGGPRGRVATLAGRAVALAALAAVALGGAALSRMRLEAAARPVLGVRHVARLELPRRVRLVGRVAGVPSRRPDGLIVMIDADAVDGLPVEGRVRVSVRGAVAKLRAGDEVRLETTLRRPRGFANPGSFDVRGHLARRGVLVTGSVWDPARIARRSRPSRTLAVRIARWRQRLVRAVARAAPGAEGAVLAALVVGDQGAVPASLRDAFARAGVVHVLSVSGLHVAIVASVAYVTFRWILLRSLRVARSADVRALAAVGSLVPVTGYAALAGLEVATVRAAVMAAAGAAALVAGRRPGVLRTLAIAALVVALAWPGAPREIAFQLSFVSVLAIVVGVRRFAPGPARSWTSRGRLAVVVSLVAAAGTAPLAARHFQQVSLIAPLANPLVVPLFGAVVVILGLGAAVLEPLAPALAARGFALAAQLLAPGIALVERLGAPAWAAVRVPAPDALELGLGWLLLGSVVSPAGRTRRLVASIALIGLLGDAAWWWSERRRDDRLRVTFLDVGQGDAAVVELPGGGVLVVDGGGFPGSTFDTGAAVVAPFLATRKVMLADALAVTHAHPDHFAGLGSLLGTTRELWSTGHPGRGGEWDRFRQAVAAAGVPERVLATGARLPPFARGVTVLHPPRGWPGRSPNDASLVLALRFGGVAMLLTGDAEAAAEEALLSHDELGRVAVLKVAHHGSRTSSTPGFVARVRPVLAVMSVGADNRYRLPAPEIEARHRAGGACVLRTDRCGAVSVTTDGRSLEVTTQLGCECPRLRPPN